MKNDPGLIDAADREVSRVKGAAADFKKRILIVEDYPMVREGLRDLVNREEDLVVCAEADCARDALAAVKTCEPDLAIVDLSLKESHGMELIKDIKAQSAKVQVLVVSRHDEDLYARRALQAGAKGYIDKQKATTHIMTSIRKVLGGEIYLSEKMTSRVLGDMASNRPGPVGTPVDSLSDRELQVLEGIGHGRNMREIAEQLHLQVKTTQTYRARILRKLGLNNAAELSRYAEQWGENLLSI